MPEWYNHKTAHLPRDNLSPGGPQTGPDANRDGCHVGVLRARRHPDARPRAHGTVHMTGQATSMDATPSTPFSAA